MFYKSISAKGCQEIKKILLKELKRKRLKRVILIPQRDRNSRKKREIYLNKETYLYACWNNYVP